jgi:diadenosine hexaphosphate hydrolase (ATP-forming)
MTQKKTRKPNPINQQSPSASSRTQSKKAKFNRSSARAKAVREYTAGGIVFHVTKDKKLEILLLSDLKGRWSIPKGHVEAGETLEQTALREVSEETGLKQLKIVDKLDKIHFFYRMRGKLIFMTTFIYMIEATDLNEDTKTEEDAPWIVEAKWFDAEQACEILEYKATRVILQEAIRRIKRSRNV